MVTAEAVKTAEKKGMPAALKIILSILTGILLLAVCAALALAMILKTAATKKNISSFIENTDYFIIPVTDDKGTEASLPELFYAYTAVNAPEKADIAKAVDSIGIKQELADRVYSYVSFVLYKTPLDEIDKRAVKKFYDDNQKGIEKGVGTKLTDDDKENFYQSLDDAKEVFEYFSEDYITGNFALPLKLVRFFVSPAGIAALAAAAALMLLLLMLIQWDPSSALITAGSIVTAIGAAGIVAAVLALGGETFVELETLSIAGVLYSAAMATFAPDVIRIVTYVLAAGLVLIIAGIYTALLRKQTKKASAQ